MNMFEPDIFLTRENDYTQKQGNKYYWIELDENNIVKQIYNEPAIGRKFVLDPIDIDLNKGIDTFTFLTSDVTHIIEDKISRYFRNIRFNTKNSTYKILIKHTSY